MTPSEAIQQADTVIVGALILIILFGAFDSIVSKRRR